MNQRIPTTFLLLASVLAATAQRGPQFGGRGGFDQPGYGQSQTNQVTLRISGDHRYIEGNGIPVHETGRFPNRNNPNTIRPQNNQFRLSMKPQVAARSTPLGLGPFGIALNGVLLEPGAAEFWQRDFNSGWQYEAKGGRINLGLDQHNAHVQPSGSYHYHAMPTGLVNRLAKDKPGQMLLIGYAADGFPVYARWGHRDPQDPKSGLVEMKPSYRLKSGTRPSGPGGSFDGTFVQDFEYAQGTGQLDECNGRFGVTPEYPAGIYHYFVTEGWPYLPRHFRGTPDPSFSRRGPGGGRGGPPFGRRGPPGGGRRPPPF